MTTGDSDGGRFLNPLRRRVWRPDSWVLTVNVCPYPRTCRPKNGLISWFFLSPSPSASSLRKLVSQVPSSAENKEGGEGGHNGGPPGKFYADPVPSPRRTWAEEMGGGSRGPGAHLVHLWPPHFAFSGHHPWDLGAHSGPALVRIWWEEEGEHGAGGRCNLFPLEIFLCFCLSLWMSLVPLEILCVMCLVCFSSSPAFFWVWSLCVCPDP